MVLVDFNGLAIGSIMGQLSHMVKSLSENLVKHIILNNLRSVSETNTQNQSTARWSYVVIVTLGVKMYSLNIKPSAKLIVLKINMTGR